MTVDKEAISEEIKKQIEEAASKEEIYEPKYGGKDHSGYETMMKYEVNDERYECFEKGAYFGYNLAAASLLKENEQLEKAFKNNYEQLMELAAHAKDLEKENEELKEALTSTEKAYEIMRDKSEYWKQIVLDLKETCIDARKYIDDFPGEFYDGKRTTYDIIIEDLTEQLKNQEK